jgi:PAS domain-containing protein
VSGRSFTCDAVAGAVINDRGTIVYWTDEAAQLTGFSAEDVCGHSVRELLPNLHGSPNAHGLIERSGEDVDLGVKRLTDALAASCRPDRALNDTGRGLLAELGDPERRDDVALLLARTRAIPQEDTANPYCGRNVPLLRTRDGLRCCTECRSAARTQLCTRCGRERPVMGRTHDGEPLCTTCRHHNPVVH